MHAPDESRLGRRPRLERADLEPDPLSQFRRWFEEARASAGDEADAMALATVGVDGAPAARMVLLTGFDHRGFTFYTSYRSRKGPELARDPRAALMFHWWAIDRQVRIEGVVEPVSPAESNAYFDSRPLASRLSAIASPQS